MLITSRREGEAILIGSDVEIEILQIGRNKVKIGVRAPDQVRVTRKEIQLVGEQNVAAATLGANLRELIVERICEKTTLNVSTRSPIRILTDTLGIR